MIATPEKRFVKDKRESDANLAQKRRKNPSENKPV